MREHRKRGIKIIIRCGICIMQFMFIIYVICTFSVQYLSVHVPSRYQCAKLIDR